VNLARKNHSHLGPEDFDFYAAPYWHEAGPPERTTPEEHRFDRWLTSLDHGVSEEPTPFPLECQLPYRVVSDAIECVEGRDERPFFLWLSFPEPHNPYQVPEPYFSMFPEDEVPERIAGPESAEGKGDKWRWLRRLIEEKRPGYDEGWRRYRANYCGTIHLIDDQIRRFVDHLGAQGLLEDTESVYAELGFGGLPYGGEERPPLHFPYRGPTFDELNSVTLSGNLKMARKGRWKLLYDSLGNGELYDLDTDPGELRNLFDDPDHRQVRLEMVEELLRWTIRTEDDLPGANYTPKRVERNWQGANRPSRASRR
jgi:arylsulfatase A-like enzyme